MSNFKREERYIVVKLARIDAETEGALREHLDSWQIPTEECVVVEHDWPIYEQTWDAVQRLAEGRPQEEDELRYLYKLVERQSGLLSGVVNAIKGEPNELTRWSHHDVPDLVQGLVYEVERLRGDAEPAGKTYQCSGCGRTTDNPHRDLSFIRKAGGVSCCPERDMKLVDTHPPPAVPEAKDWNQATGRDGLMFTDGWNACRDAMLDAAPQPAEGDE